MRKLKLLFLVLILSVLFFPLTTKATSLAEKMVGKILLQVEDKGQAWYVYPQDLKKYYLGRPADALAVMQKLGLGVRPEIINQDLLPSRLKGMIILDVLNNGEAYYVNPQDLKKYYLGRPADALAVMQKLGLGISNNDLKYINRGEVKEEIENSASYLTGVPFTSQAPNFNWSDSRLQDGCEETSALMAIKWAKGENLDKDEALTEILNISDYLKDAYGEYRDISVTDVNSWIFHDYFNYQNTKVLYDVNMVDIIDELAKGNLVIAPFNGQLLNNPYFTGLGPERHMLVIRGYEKENNTFITNDPGTRYGENYKYPGRVLFAAIRDYETGYHKPIKEVKKNIIVISK
ncbi:MAG: hypothetical protein PWQ35_99 [Patescibacteria group bacterium]|nr:hypothetical protein [Patescibacteria group bacterium]